MITDISNQERTSKIPLSSIWKKYFDLPDDSQKNGETGKAFLNSKEDLKRTLDQMEADDLTMMDGDDVILTN